MKAAFDGIPCAISASDSRIRAYLRRGTQAEFRAANPILRDYEIAYEKDTDRFKVGDGKTPWNDLPYYSKEARV